MTLTLYTERYSILITIFLNLLKNFSIISSKRKKDLILYNNCKYYKKYYVKYLDGFK